MKIYTHRTNGSQSDMETFASVSRPLETHGTTNDAGYLRVLLGWFNLQILCQRMSIYGMNSIYEWSDPRNQESDDLSVRLQRTTYAVPYTPNEIRDSLIHSAEFYMDGKNRDCGFDVWIFQIRYHADTNTLELKIDQSMLR